MPNPIAGLPVEAILGTLVGFSPSIAFVCLCVLQNRMRRRHETPVPADVRAAPRPYDLHPALLGAQRFRKDREGADGANAASTALAAIVRLVGRGEVSFAERRGVPQGPGPVVPGGRRRAPDQAHDDALEAYGARLWLEVRDPARLDGLDAGALSLLTPSARASIEQVCGLPERRRGSYRRLKHYLRDLRGALAETGLARPAGPLSRLVFGPGAILCAISSLVGPAALAANPDPALAPLCVAAAIAVMLCRGALVDLGPTLTPTGADALATALGTVRWAESLGAGADRLGELAERDVPGVLATLLAMGRVDLAEGLAARLGEAPVTGDGSSPTQQALLLCRPRPFHDSNGVRRDVSPAGLVVEEIGEYCRVIES